METFLSLSLFLKKDHNRQHQDFHANPKDFTLIIALYNENKNIAKNFLMWDSFADKGKIIFIDDYSQDQGFNTLTNLVHNSNNKARISILKNNFSKGKKGALLTSKTVVDTPYVLFTDADCQFSESWPLHMIDDTSDLILGHAPFFKRPGLLNAFSRYENFTTAQLYLSLAIYNMPYMGVGRNMLSKSSLFIQDESLDDHRELQSGDDDLFIQNHWDSAKINVSIDPGSFVYSESEKIWKKWIAQKRRHHTTSAYYHWKHKLFLASYYGVIMAFWFFLALGFFQNTTLAGLLFCCFFVILFVLKYFWARQLKEVDLLWKLPLLDLCFVIYLYALGVMLPFKATKWK